MSGTKRLLLAVAVLFLGARCIIVPGRRVYVPPPPPGHSSSPPPRSVPPPPPSYPAPPPSRLLNEGEAVNVGLRYCQSHALPCDLKEAHLTGNGVWKVKFRVRGYDEKGHVHLQVDARNGSILEVDEKVRDRNHRR